MSSSHTSKLPRKLSLIGLSLLALIMVLSLLVGCGETASPTPSTQPVTSAPVTTPASSPSATPEASASPSPSTAPAPSNPDMILATTTSTRDSGLLDALLPLFEQKTARSCSAL